MLSITDFTAFERFLEGSLNGNANAFDLTNVSNFNGKAAGIESVAQATDLNLQVLDR